MSKLQAVEDCLANYSLSTDNLEQAVVALRELLGAEKAFLYSFGHREGGDDLVLTRQAFAAPSDVAWGAIFADYLRGRGVQYGVYNALHPEPEQRNKVMDTREIRAVSADRADAMDDELYSRLGVRGHDTLRVLVCDGPSLLAWVGIIQQEPTTEAQRQLLEGLVPVFARRLTFERMFQQARLSDAALTLALEEIGGPAWVVRADGSVAHANAAGRARLDREGAELASALRARVLQPRGESRRFKATRRRDEAGSDVHIVVETALSASSNGSAGLDVAEAVRRLGLTPAQTRVFELLAGGSSNAAIAASLGIAERTVEAHVTAILMKAQVPNRATLIVRVFEGSRARSASA
ncbi:MAG: Transcriptional regulator, LuxR family [Labilithrix sp.]|nr:Transcriptional regulator, LuxR family [Labilithrix sp.]